jgi:putative Holliday junction resolvase
MDHPHPRPLPPLAATGTLAKDAALLAAAARKEEAQAVALGLPLVGGEETKMSRICRKLGQELEKQGLEVKYVNEEFTSHEAEEEMRAAGMKGSQIRKAVDGEAASRILLRLLGDSE